MFFFISSILNFDAAKIVQTKGTAKKKDHFFFDTPECSLSSSVSSKIVQTKGTTKKKDHFFFDTPECSLSSSVSSKMQMKIKRASYTARSLLT